jgi:lipopolysaccharide assembly outer membrane protein LptD (OstA)
MWSAVFSIKKVPIFYWPYLRYPLNQERATGFLMPQLGYSGSKGFIFEQSFYWAIRRNVDSSLDFDYYSARGLGGGLELRYLLGQGSGGQLNLFFFKFKQEPGKKAEDNAYIFRLNHNQPLPLKFNLVAHIDYQTSFDFLREFDNNFKRAVISNRTSQVYLSRSWSYFNFNARVSRFETYFAQIKNSIISTNLPQISFNSFRIKLFSPLYFSFSSTFSRWQYGWKDAYDKGKQTKSQNLTFSPALTVPFTEIPWLTMNSSVGASLAYYSQSYAPSSKTVVYEPLLTRNYNANVELVGPIFFKIYRGSDGTPKLKHIIEPTVTYRYESPVTSADRVITAYGYLIRYDQINYTLVNRFLIKQDEMPREVFTWGIGQTYYFSPEDSPLRLYQVEGKFPKFSDVTSYLRFYPASKYSIDFSAGYNTAYKTLSSIRLGANLGNPADPLFLRINWYKSVNPYRQNAIWNRHQIGGYAGFKPSSLPLELEAEMDFNIQQRKMLYSAFSFTYNYQCLEFKADFRVFYFRDKPETQFRISIGLGNIGKTTDFLGGIGF